MLEITKEDIFQVSDVNKIVKNVVGELPLLWVEGEIANYTSHSSGHIYFSLKDKTSTLRCAFFRQYNIDSRYYPKDGDKVLCSGKLDVYEKTGSYQLIVRQLLPAGIGDLQIKFNALKEKLSAEGLFAPEHKQQIPEYPETIGVITSPTGAAFQDIKNILTRRFPCHIYLYPATVQGDNAPQELIAGLRYFNEEFPVDTIIIGRGGGSQEDLFCFNDEALARAIFASHIPVISAVGHEIDFTIADFVADHRAPTPSAAAEIAVPDRRDLAIRLKNLERELRAKCRQQLLHYNSILRSAEKTLYQNHPRNIFFQYQQQLDDLVAKFSGKLDYIPELRYRLQSLGDRLVYRASQRSAEELHQKKLQLEMLRNRLVNSIQTQIETRHSHLNEMKHQLAALSPYEALKRGYGIIRKEEKIINSVRKIVLDDRLYITLQDGNCQCRVEKIEEN